MAIGEILVLPEYNANKKIRAKFRRFNGHLAKSGSDVQLVSRKNTCLRAAKVCGRVYLFFGFFLIWSCFMLYGII